MNWNIIYSVNTLPLNQIFKIHSRWSPSMRVGRRSPTSRSWQRWREPWVGNFTFIFTWNPTILGSTTQLTFTHITFPIPGIKLRGKDKGKPLEAKASGDYNLNFNQLTYNCWSSNLSPFETTSISDFLSQVARRSRQVLGQTWRWLPKVFSSDYYHQIFYLLRDRGNYFFLWFDCVAYLMKGFYALSSQVSHYYFLHTVNGFYFEEFWR